jgi:hypothetical protein
MKWQMAVLVEQHCPPFWQMSTREELSGNVDLTRALAEVGEQFQRLGATLGAGGGK